MTSAIQLTAVSDAELAVNAVALAKRARHYIAKVARPDEAARFVHDAKAIKDRISKLRLAKEQAFEAEFPWTMAWLEGMRRTGVLIASGQEAGSIATRGRPNKSNSLLYLSDLEIEAIEASRWQRLAEAHDEDWRTFEEMCYDDRRQPTLTAALRLASGEGPDEQRPWLRIFNVWNFQKRDEGFGLEHPGNIPGQIIQNLNYYFTEPGDVVVDLFGGGGVTIDVCKANDDDYGNRKCRAYDIAPVRKDIARRDVLADGVPDISDAALVFLDPPYWGQKKGDYSADPTNLANLGIDAFHDALERIVKDCLRCPGVVALIIGASQYDGVYRDHAAEMVRRINVPIVLRAIVPYTTQQYQAFTVARAKEKRQWLNLYRDLIVWGSGTEAHK